VGWGETVHLVRPPLLGLLNQPQMKDKYEKNDGIKFGGGNRTSRRKAAHCHSVHHKSRIPRPEQKPSSHDGKQATNRLGYSLYLYLRQQDIAKGLLHFLNFCAMAIAEGLYTGRIFSVRTRSTALRFTAADEPLAARRIRILPMNQHAWSEHKLFLALVWIVSK
jgi:hypothetical protein